MDMTMGFYGYNEENKQVWYGRAVDIIEAYKDAMAETGLVEGKITVERA